MIKKKMILLIAIMALGITACTNASEDVGDRYANALLSNLQSSADMGGNPDMATILVNADKDAVKKQISHDISEVYLTVSNISNDDTATAYIEAMVLAEYELMAEYGGIAAMSDKDYQKEQKTLKSTTKAQLEEFDNKYKDDKKAKRAFKKAGLRLFNMMANPQYIQGIILANQKNN